MADIDDKDEIQKKLKFIATYWNFYYYCYDAAANAETADYSNSLL